MGICHEIAPFSSSCFVSLVSVEPNLMKCSKICILGALGKRAILHIDFSSVLQESWNDLFFNYVHLIKGG